MLPWITVAIITAAAVALRGLPRSFLRAYASSFVGRHGVSVQLGLAVLAAMTLSMLIATLVLPERKPLIMELVNIAVVTSMLAAGAADVYFFARARGRGR